MKKISVLNKTTKTHDLLIDILQKDYNLTKREIFATTLYPLLTYKEIGSLNIFNCGVDNVRQIYQKASRKLKHPKNRVKWTTKYKELLKDNADLTKEINILIKMIAEGQINKSIVEKYNLNMACIFSKKISDFEMTTRLSTALRCENIVFVGDVVKNKEQFFTRIPNCGKQSVMELKTILKNIDCEFGMDLMGWVRPMEDENYYN